MFNGHQSPLFKKTLFYLLLNINLPFCLAFDKIVLSLRCYKQKTTTLNEWNTENLEKQACRFLH